MAERPTLRKGSTGTAVRDLQKALDRAGFDPGPIDGIFGARTERAVRAFQKTRKLTVDGIVGPRTWAALEPTQRHRGLGLHIGLNRVDPDHYWGWDGQLIACEFDAKDMQALAKKQGMESRLLLTAKATADAVLDGVRHAASTLKSGDLFFLTYSGHGGQVPDVRSEEKDHMDETWVLYDRELLDDELYALWATFKPGVRIVVLSDSCHSGTVVKVQLYERFLLPEAAARGFAGGGRRGPAVPRTKNLPKDIEERTYQQHKALYDGIQAGLNPDDRAKVQASVMLISGCQDNQESADGERNGLFTEMLRRTWDDGRFRGTYRQFHKKLSEPMPPWQSPNYFITGAANPAFENQRPFTV